MTNQERKDTIKCPKCEAVIPVTETLQHQLTESVRNEYEEKMQAERNAASEQEAQLKARVEELNTREKDIEKRFEQTLKDELEKQQSQLRSQLVEEAKKEAQEAQELELEDLRSTLKEREEKLKEARETEMLLRKRERELEDREKEMELEVARTLEREKRNMEDAIMQRMSNEYRMKEAEKDKRIDDMRKTIEDLKRKSEQGSQQTQGEVQELELEKELAEFFPSDNIQPVPKGMQGADVVQEVISSGGKLCGSLIWESKRTKNWSDGWIAKLKEDQRAARAEIAIIITETLPKGITNFGMVNGVWVTSYPCFRSLAVALRKNLVDLSSARSMAEGKSEKADILFQYVTGTEFRQRVEAIVEAFSGMKEDIDKERRIFERSWAKREKQLQTVMLNTSGMFGDMQGLLGPSLQSIPALESGEVEDEEEDV